MHAGCMMISALLSFPTDAVKPIVRGAQALARQHATALHALATDRTGGRVLEAAFKPGSALPAAVQRELIQAFASSSDGAGVTAAAMSPAGGWVVSAMWSAAETMGEEADEVMAMLAKPMLALGECAVYPPCRCVIV
jgi:hypothetical protein